MASIRVEGLNRVMDSMGARKKKALKEGAVSKFLVGYTAPYATFVHENLEAHHPNGGQAKFLEQPMRENARDYRFTITAALRAGKSMRQALLLAANRLKADSQKLCPVDTGKLVLSAFIRLF